MTADTFLLRTYSFVAFRWHLGESIAFSASDEHEALAQLADTRAALPEGEIATLIYADGGPVRTPHGALLARSDSNRAVAATNQPSAAGSDTDGTAGTSADGTTASGGTSTPRSAD